MNELLIAVASLGGLVHSDVPNPTYDDLIWDSTQIPEVEVVAEVARLKTVEEIEAIEATITPRMLRGAALGDAVSIQKLADIEAYIALLR